MLGYGEEAVMQTIVVTGGSGFIGSSIAYSLSSKYNVRILDVSEPPASLANRVEYVYTDIRCYDDVLRAIRDADLVVHAAIIQIPRINQEKKLGYEVNILGTHNVAKAVDESSRVKGMILLGSWHVLGEYGLAGIIDESFGYRPDHVEDRARLYALSKIGQEVIVRFYNEFSDKVYFIARLGTVLGEGMPEKTAANIFISNALKGKAITPYKHSMYRPMFYVDVNDVVKIVKAIIDKILLGELKGGRGSLDNVVTIAYPEPITILDLANMIKELVEELTNGKIRPLIKIVDTGKKILYSPEDKYKVKLSLRRLNNILGSVNLTHPREALKRIILKRLSMEKG